MGFLASVSIGVWYLMGLLLAGYVASVLLHPYVRCETCKGTGRHSGSVFTNAYRPCHKCSGGGRKQRLGARLIGRGSPRTQGSKIAGRTGK